MATKETGSKPQRFGNEQQTAANSKLRLLDFDDLFLLTYLLEGATVAATAKRMGLTQPAITQRVRKIERVFGEPILQRAGRHVRLTKFGRSVCARAADALTLVGQVAPFLERMHMTIGTRNWIAKHWLWPVLRDLQATDPKLRIHCYVGSEEELAGLLEQGILDACLWSAPRRLTNVTAVEMGETELVMVAAPQMARTITKVSDLSEQVLIEVDRSMVFYGHVDPAIRAQVDFQDIWYLGDLDEVIAAVASGFGVAVVPRYLVASHVAAERVVPVLPDLSVAPEKFILQYRVDAVKAPTLDSLMSRLKIRTPQ